MYKTNGVNLQNYMMAIKPMAIDGMLDPQKVLY